jgi:ABC-2 type transport system ATP-binding protein
LQELRKTQPTCIAVAPQDYAFYPTLTVAENLDCFAGVGGLGGAAKAGRVASCIEFAQLQNYRHVQAQRLSGGLKRRLNLSIALLHRPQLILFDEPTVGVDPQSRAFLLEAVKTLAANGSAVIYTSHYMEEVQAIADRIVVLDGGKVLRQGTLAELLGSTQQLYVALAQGQDRAQLRHILSRWGDGVDQGEGVCLTLPSGTALADVLNILTQAGLELRQVNYGAMNLEQLFMQLTHRSLRD